MGMMRHPGKDGRGRAGRMLAPGRYEVSMRLSVRDAGLLWRMAAVHALSQGTLTEEDVIEMFGPMEDPSLADCIAMLVGPGDLAGCCFEEFSVKPAEPAVRHTGKARPAHTAPGRAPLVLPVRGGGMETAPETGISERK